MTKTELAKQLARECGTDILDDPLTIAEAMENYDLTGDWQEMEALIREALAAPRVDYSEGRQDDATRSQVLEALAQGEPYVFIRLNLDGESPKIAVETGNGVGSASDLEAALNFTLNHLRAR